MGNWITFKTELRDQLKPYCKLTLGDVKKIIRRFESIQSGFGWGIQLQTFAKLFKISIKDAEPLWACWDTDNNGVTDVLEILSGLTLVCVGKFHDKLEACFNLFDFDESKTLTADEMSICIKTCVCGLCKLLDQPEPPEYEIEQLASKAFAACEGGKRGGVNQELFLKWVIVTPTVIGIVTRFGTTDANAVKSKYSQIMAEDRAAAKIQGVFKGLVIKKKELNSTSSSNTSSTSNNYSHVHSKIDSIRKGENSGAFNYNLSEIKKFKELFDSIDRDSSGSISVKELLRSFNGQTFMESTLRSFQTLDVDSSGSISFDEFLKVVYPSARVKDVQNMIMDISIPDINQENITELLEFFEEHDDDFDGKIHLHHLIKKMEADHRFAKFVQRLSDRLKTDKRSMTWLECVETLFRGLYREKWHLILKWASQRGVFVLNEKQHAELEQLFSIYDKDGSGTIDMKELKDHFLGLGFTKDDITRMFSKYDRNGSGEVDLVEFKRFYREVWDTTPLSRKSMRSTKY